MQRESLKTVFLDRKYLQRQKLFEVATAGVVRIFSKGDLQGSGPMGLNNPFNVQNIPAAWLVPFGSKQAKARRVFVEHFGQRICDERGAQLLAALIGNIPGPPEKFQARRIVHSAGDADEIARTITPQAAGSADHHFVLLTLANAFHRKNISSRIEELKKMGTHRERE